MCKLKKSCYIDDCKRPHYKRLQGNSICLENSAKLFQETTCGGSGRKRVWLHIGRVKLNTSKNDIMSYLQNKFPNNEFTVENLLLREDTATRSFKVSGVFEQEDDLEKDKNWPRECQFLRIAQTSSKQHD